MQNITRAVEKSLLAGKGTRRRLPRGGRLQIDRLAPMIVVHRRRTNVEDQATDELLANATSALIGRDSVAQRAKLDGGVGALPGRSDA